jgi:hypothetical protein
MQPRCATLIASRALRTMDRIEQFVTPIRRTLEIHPISIIVALSLGVSIYRWNAHRVRFHSGKVFYFTERGP